MATKASGGKLPGLRAEKSNLEKKPQKFKLIKRAKKER